MAAPAIVIIAMVALFDRGRRRDHLIYGLGCLILFLGAQLLLSRWYYGTALPNTYYLKMTGYPMWPRIENGAERAKAFLMGIGPLALVLTGAFVGLRRDAKVLILAAVFGCQIAYSIYVGGDAWEWYGGANRYIAPAMPLFVILLASALAATANALTDLISQWAIHARGDWIKAGILCVLTVAAFAALRPRSHFFTRLSDRLMLNPPQQDEHIDHLKMALHVDQLTDPDATIAVVWAGILPYFADRYAVDLLGKNDATIAHEPMHLDPQLGFYPGHLKWDYDYSIGTLRPDVIVETWKGREELQRAISPSYSPVIVDGYTWYFRTGSPHVLWAEVEKVRLLNFETLRRSLGGR
jgi:hypothetical protein